MSNSTNITNNPADACPITLGWYVPDTWRNSTSSNFSQAACAAPACDNFPMKLAECCGRPHNVLQYFDTRIGPYASCALVDNNDTKAYAAFQSCLADQEVRGFKCNSQDGFGVQSGCDYGISEPPINNTDWPNQQTCSLPISINATRAMKKCCSNYGNNGEGLVVFSEGCSIGCTSNSTNGTFNDCIGDNYNNPHGFLCTINDGRENPDTSVGAQASPSLVGVLTVLLLGSSMLML
ncbi:hypothetical protein E4T48_00859 [Aureobasidium sp. EXF-10727]|nr:hypothetical protein E4T48_00859 [Aureobasidium sp. EXF-10727]KAI4730731.1 hypothetical protein E4T49_01558 [Aureobasidium sp. EXF-10728]